jgi:hypothetical protein
VAVDYLELPYEIIVSQLAWQARGLTWTASGYGAKIPSDRMVVFSNGRKYRIYVTIYSNIGSAWITKGGKRLYIRGDGY